MRIYLDQKIKKKENELLSVTCNCCKKELLVENGILKEECISFAHLFGYFSDKDGEKHRFDLCEQCYDKLIANFQLPVEKEQRNELV
ncbi:MAG: hypothetical protein NC314_10110 [Roseburia sp.]|nr:hypothetical protein [Roseburia sp.]MCM1243185.1 hypothetical protein [Roseburia sp.]